MFSCFPAPCSTVKHANFVTYYAENGRHIKHGVCVCVCACWMGGLGVIDVVGPFCSHGRLRWLVFGDSILKAGYLQAHECHIIFRIRFMRKNVLSLKIVRRHTHTPHRQSNRP